MTGDWRDQAACLDEDPELFFPQPKDEDGEQAAKAVCAGCQVTATCLAFALEKRADWGVFGGLNGDERDKTRRNVRRRETRAVTR